MRMAPPLTPRTGSHDTDTRANAPPLLETASLVVDIQSVTVHSPTSSDSSTTDGGSSPHAVIVRGPSGTVRSERRKTQVRVASSTRRRKQREETQFLNARIKEIQDQLECIKRDMNFACGPYGAYLRAGVTSPAEANADTIQECVARIQALEVENDATRSELFLHESWVRLIQYGLDALPTEVEAADPNAAPDGDESTSASAEPLPCDPPPLWMGDCRLAMIDPQAIHETVSAGYSELQSFAPAPTQVTNLCVSMGWRAELWNTNMRLSYRVARKEPTEAGIMQLTQSTWDMLQSPQAWTRLCPDIRGFAVLQQVSDDVVVIRRVVAMPAGHPDREFVSVLFRYAEVNTFVVGIKSLDAPMLEYPEASCVRAEELHGWIFTSPPETATIPSPTFGSTRTPAVAAAAPASGRVEVLGYVDVKGNRDDKLLTHLANEVTFGALRWESEAAFPLPQ